MKMKLIRLAVQELRHATRRKSHSTQGSINRHLGTVLFILVIGFFGPLLTAALRTSVNDYMQLRSKEMLSADLSIRSTRSFKTEEIETIRSLLRPVKEAFETEFVTMAKGRDVATLVEVKGVTPSYPVIGEFRFQSGEVQTSAEGLHQDGVQEEKLAWAYPEALAQLGLKLGDSIGIGASEFKIAGVLKEAPGGMRLGGFAPHVYIAHKHIEETGLLQFGSQVSHRLYFKLPPDLSLSTGTEALKDVLADPDIFLRTPDDTNRSFERFFGFFNLYLVSAMMIVFALSWAGAFYILQIFIQDRLKNAAILMAVGASRIWTGMLYALQILLITTVALLIALGLVAIVVISVPFLAGDLLPEGFIYRLSFKDIGTFALISVISSLAFSIPLFVRLYLLRLQTLLGESSLGVERIPKWVQVLSYLPVLGVFFALSIWLLESVSHAAQLLGGLLLAAFIGWWIGRLLFRSFFVLVRSRPGLLRLVSTQLARSRFGVSLCFLALLLVAIVLNLVPHLLKSAINEISPAGGREVPALFLFNIPESAVDSLQAFARERDRELRYVSPMILARVMSVNDQPTEIERLQKFPVRLTYRESLIPAETLVEGEEFKGPFDPDQQTHPQVSMEERYAERNGFKIGDVIEFDLQGIPITGEIVNLRRVKWTEFNPNFFMVFQPGVLEDAPKTYLANVFTQKEILDDNDHAQFQYELIRDFPDLSVIDVNEAIRRGLEVVDTMIGPIQAAAWSAVFMCFLVLIGVISHNLKLRHAEVDIEKLLGADSQLIRRLMVSEYALVAVLAVVFGSVSAVAVTSVVTVQIFEVTPSFEFLASAGSAVVIIGATTAIAWISCARVLNLRGTSRKL